MNVRLTAALAALCVSTGLSLVGTSASWAQPDNATARVKPASACFALGQKYGTGCYAQTRKAGTVCFQQDNGWFAKTAYSGRKARTVVCVWKNVLSGGKWYQVPSNW